MKKIPVPIGSKFSLWITVSEVFDSGKYRYSVKCKCVCGVTKQVLLWNLKKGLSKSCGCTRKEKPGHKTHGWTSRSFGKHGLPLYHVWSCMKQRCCNPKHISFSTYGGKGITVCERWMKFENFLSDMGHRPPKTSLDRIDNSKGYSPENCRWASKLVQVNNKVNNRIIEMNGKKDTAANWCRAFGISQSVFLPRINKLGWTVERALTEPVNMQFSHARKNKGSLIIKNISGQI